MVARSMIARTYAYVPAYCQKVRKLWWSADASLSLSEPTVLWQQHGPGGSCN
jgi:hypothetical protein